LRAICGVGQAAGDNERDEDDEPAEVSLHKS